MQDFEELERRLTIAQAAYQHALFAIDRDLRVIVRTKPKLLEKAQTIQDRFVFKPEVQVLAAAEHPAAANELKFEAIPSKRQRSKK